MSDLLSQVSYPVFLYLVFLFFIFASVFSFIVGVGLALRNETMLRVFGFMNRWVSMRRITKPLARPRSIKPVVLKHRRLFGAGIVLGAAASIYLLLEINPERLQSVFSDSFSYFTAKVLADYTESFLLIGNGVCVAIGLLVLFFPQLLSNMESYTDKWYTLRKQTLPLNRMHYHVDKWVLAHPTVSGITLSILSACLGVSMYVRL